MNIFELIKSGLEDAIDFFRNTDKNEEKVGLISRDEFISTIASYKDFDKCPNGKVPISEGAKKASLEIFDVLYKKYKILPYDLHNSCNIELYYKVDNLAIGLEVDYEGWVYMSKDNGKITRWSYYLNTERKKLVAEFLEPISLSET